MSILRKTIGIRKSIGRPRKSIGMSNSKQHIATSTFQISIAKGKEQISISNQQIANGN